MTLQTLRNQIDEIDEEIIKLLRKRLDITMEVAKIKKESHLDVFDKSREEKIKEKLRELCLKNRLEYSIIEQIFTLYINYCKTVMKYGMDE